MIYKIVFIHSADLIVFIHSVDLIIALAKENCYVDIGHYEYKITLFVVEEIEIHFKTA